MMKSHSYHRLTPVLAAGFAAFSMLGIGLGPAHGGSEPASGTRMVYDIYHEDYGHIGEQRVTFTRRSEPLVVDVEIDIAVEMLGLTLYRFEGKRRQEWQDGRLVGFESETHDDGRDFALSAELVDGEMQINSQSGASEAPGGIFPTDPWNRDIVEQSLLMDTKTGELRRVEVSEVGEETLEIGGRPVATTKYEATGDEEREVWYDDEDTWVQLRFERDGSEITFRLRELDTATTQAQER